MKTVQGFRPSNVESRSLISCNVAPQRQSCVMLMWHFFDQFYFASVTTHFYIYNTDDADNADDTDDDADNTDDDADVRTWPITPTTVSSQRTLHSIISLSHQTFRCTPLPIHHVIPLFCCPVSLSVILLNVRGSNGYGIYNVAISQSGLWRT